MMLPKRCEILNIVDPKRYDPQVFQEIMQIVEPIEYLGWTTGDDSDWEEDGGYESEDETPTLEN